MYRDRLRVLRKAFKSAESNNALYNEAKKQHNLQEQQLTFLVNLQSQLKAFDLAVTNNESEWRDAVLSVLETEIVNDLNYVFPTDGYNVSLSTKVLRGKIHITVQVRSFNVSEMPGRITGTQGRLFQQVVSFAALISVISLLGINTVYIDEAFSGSSKGNIKKIGRLLDSLKERGFNIIMIAQDTSLADGLDANRLVLVRTIDNKTIITQDTRTV